MRFWTFSIRFAYLENEHFILASVLHVFCTRLRFSVKNIKYVHVKNCSKNNNNNEIIIKIITSTKAMHVMYSGCYN